MGLVGPEKVPESLGSGLPARLMASYTASLII